MNIKTVRATATNLMKALEAKHQQTINLLNFDNNRNDFEMKWMLLKDYYKKKMEVASMLSMLYITALSTDYEKYTAEMEELQDKVLKSDEDLIEEFC